MLMNRSPTSLESHQRTKPTRRLQNEIQNREKTQQKLEKKLNQQQHAPKGPRSEYPTPHAPKGPQSVIQNTVRP